MSSDGRSLLAHGFHGAFHLWHDARGDNQWTPLVPVSGHFNAVEDVAWDPRGHYFASVRSVVTPIPPQHVCGWAAVR